MAKRKRLSPPSPDQVSPELETKSYDGLGAAPVRISAPISTVARETAAQAALEEVTETLTRARDEGRMILSLPVADLKIDYLIRDRLPVADEEMGALIDSLRTRGQQTPIEVVALEGGAYGLISGWRRCKALAHLYDETGEARFATVQALVRQPEQASDAYLAMVEENEIRVGLSFYERARIVARTVETDVYDSEKDALLTLFASASRSKRSKIRSFLTVVSALDGALRFPQDLGERLGLQLAKALEDRPGLAQELKAGLARENPQTAEAELGFIQSVLTPQKKALNTGLEPHKPQEIAPGVTVKAGKGGAITLSGPGWTDAMRDRLIAWVKAEMG